MRKRLILLPVFLSATPALAQPATSESIQIPRELTDPATTERLAGTMQALSKALLDMRVGELKAAAEGREATSAERRMTVRDMARRQDPNFERKLERQIAQSGPMIRQGIKAMSDALPAMMQGLEQAQKALERAAANMPDPTYPRR
jgi:hypothetical protein